ncbi:MAG: universal stress protein [Actinomycetota bacterium]|nr:universal stress protein [Actinomycetota bacterium]
MRVLYATDGGQAARDAGRLLDRVARRDEVEVTVMSVADLEGVGSGAELDERQSLAERSRAKASQTVQAATARLKDAGFVVEERLAEGDPTAEIVKVVEQDPHDITLLGAGNKTWLGRLLHGSTSTQVLHSSPSAVLIVHQAPAEGLVQVIVADDGSDGAQLAAQLFVELADPGRCLVTVLGVTTLMDLALVPEVSQLDPASIPTDPVEVGEIESRRIADARKRVQRTAGLLTEAGFRADARAVVGHPAEEILKAAQLTDFALVVMGSRGLGGVGRALLGSVSDEVRRHSAAALIARRPPSPA